MNNNKESLEEVLYVLDYLKGTGVPCDITLYYQDKNFVRTKRGVHINLDKIPMDIIKGDRNYLLMIMINESHGGFVIENHPSILQFSQNKWFIEYLEETMNDNYGEEIINHQRWTRLDDILNDPNPQPLTG